MPGFLARVLTRFLARRLTRFFGQVFLGQEIQCTVLLGRRKTVLQFYRDGENEKNTMYQAAHNILTILFTNDPTYQKPHSMDPSGHLRALQKAKHMFWSLGMWGYFGRFLRGKDKG